MTWLFDYDLTLYGFDEAEVLWSLDRNITRFLEKRFGFTKPQADAVRKDYCARFGTTLGGLRALHGVSPDEYFDFIHAGDSLQVPGPNPAKRELLMSLPGDRWVFTNARSDWALRGLRGMGIEDCFAGILDIESFGWDSKPSDRVYGLVEERVGVQGAGLVMVEDKPENLVPAHARGWRTILVHPECAGMEVACDLRLHSLLDLALHRETWNGW